MPIHSPGYRTWDGRKVAGHTRWAVIATTGIRRTWKSKWLRRMLFFAVLPTLFLAIPFFLFEQASQDPQRWRVARGFLTILPANVGLNSLLTADLNNVTPEQIQDGRRQVWSFLLLTLFDTPKRC